MVYLASHNRTLHEVLFPAAKDIRLAYEGSFAGMTTEPVQLEALLGIPHLEELPAIRWRLQNLEQLARSNPARFRALAGALDEKLSRV